MRWTSDAPRHTRLVVLIDQDVGFRQWHTAQVAFSPVVDIQARDSDVRIAIVTVGTARKAPGNFRDDDIAFVIPQEAHDLGVRKTCLSSSMDHPAVPLARAIPVDELVTAPVAIDGIDLACGRRRYSTRILLRDLEHDARIRSPVEVIDDEAIRCAHRCAHGRILQIDEHEQFAALLACRKREIVTGR
jgi:hypothetical protein